MIQIAEAHSEIVTVVDDCHANLINKSDQRPRFNMIQRRSRSSSGVNNVVVKNWPDHRQNSYETVIAALDEENLIINNVDFYPENERYPTASMPLHSRLSTSNEALTRPNSRPDGYDTVKSCSECTDQYYLTRSLHRRHVSGHGSKKRGKGASNANKVIVCPSIMANEAKKKAGARRRRIEGQQWVEQGAESFVVPMRYLQTPPSYSCKKVMAQCSPEIINK